MSRICKVISVDICEYKSEHMAYIVDHSQISDLTKSQPIVLKDSHFGKRIGFEFDGENLDPSTNRPKTWVYLHHANPLYSGDVHLVLVVQGID